MEPYTVHRPDEAAIRRILEKHPYDAVGMAVRLAWMAGLLRNEIVSLRWDAVNFLNQEIELPDRSIPLCQELEEYLARMSERLDWGSNYVLLSPDNIPLDDKDKENLQKVMEHDPLSLIEYWSIDPDYDGDTFRSTWQDYRENVDNDSDPLHCVYSTRIAMPHKDERKVCVKAVDVFGFESQVILDVKC